MFLAVVFCLFYSTCLFSCKIILLIFWFCCLLFFEEARLAHLKFCCLLVQNRSVFIMFYELLNWQCLLLWPIYNGHFLILKHLVFINFFMKVHENLNAGCNVTQSNCVLWYPVSVQSACFRPSDLDQMVTRCWLQLHWVIITPNSSFLVVFT